MHTKRNKVLEQLAFQTKNMKEKVEYLKNKIICASQVETALRE